MSERLLPDEMLEEVATRFALLGDPTRLRIVRALHEFGERTVGEIAEAAGTTVPNASAHLARLRGAGIVARTRSGRNARYRIADPTIDALCRTVCASVRERARLLIA